MEQPQHLDGLAPDAVHHNERRADDHQLAGSWFAPGVAHLRMLQQHVRLCGNVIALGHCVRRVVLYDVVKLGIPVVERPC